MVAGSPASILQALKITFVKEKKQHFKFFKRTHVTTREKGYLMGESLSPLLTNPPLFLVIGLVEVEIKRF